MDRAERIGRWVSGIGHVGLIAWLLLAGALFRPQEGPVIRMSEVATMTEADFQDYAAAARGSGPVAVDTVSDVATLGELPQSDPASPAEDVPAAAAEPEVADVAQPLAEPATTDSAPDLAGLQPGDPVNVPPSLPQVSAGEAADQIATPAPVEAPQIAANPSSPELPQAQQGQTAPQIAPPAQPQRSALALDGSARPVDVAGARARQQAAAAEAQRLAAEAAARAERDRQAAAEAAAAAERDRQAAAAAAAAEAQRQAAAERERQQAADAARRAAEAEEARQQEAARRAAEADRQRQQEEARQQAEAERAQQEEDARRAAEAAAEQERQAEDARRQAEAEAAAERERQAAEAARPDVTGDDALAQALAEAVAAERNTGSAGTENTGLSEELRRARDDAARAEQEVRDADASAAVGALQTGPQPDILASALDQALDVPGREDANGPPLSRSEIEAFRLAIDNCWNKGSLSREASAMTVSIRFSMAANGMPISDTIRLMDHQGGSPAGAQQAFDVGRRAIIGCAGAGYPLPPEKYNRWKDVIIDFRPDGIALN